MTPGPEEPSESREMTVEECRNAFLDHVHALIRYWNRVEKDTCLERLEGLAFSILTAIDGVSGDLPGFDLVTPELDDEVIEGARERGEDWWPDRKEIGEGALHELFHSRRPGP